MAKELKWTKGFKMETLMSRKGELALFISKTKTDNKVCFVLTIMDIVTKHQNNIKFKSIKQAKQYSKSI